MANVFAWLYLIGTILGFVAVLVKPDLYFKPSKRTETGYGLQLLNGLLLLAFFANFLGLF